MEPTDLSGLNKMLLWSTQFYQCSMNCDYRAHKLISGTIMSLLGMLPSQQLIHKFAVHAAFFELCFEPCYAIIVFHKIKLFQKVLVSPSTGDKIDPLVQPLSNYVSSCQLLLKKKGRQTCQKYQLHKTTQPA